jgi:hypothetical protein
MSASVDYLKPMRWHLKASVSAESAGLQNGLDPCQILLRIDPQRGYGQRFLHMNTDAIP